MVEGRVDYGEGDQGAGDHAVERRDLFQAAVHDQCSGAALVTVMNAAGTGSGSRAQPGRGEEKVQRSVRASGCLRSFGQRRLVEKDLVNVERVARLEIHALTGSWTGMVWSHWKPGEAETKSRIITQNVRATELGSGEHHGGSAAVGRFNRRADLLEAAELVRSLKRRLRRFGGGSSPGDDGRRRSGSRRAAPAEEKTEFTVVLTALAPIRSM